MFLSNIKTWAGERGVSRLVHGVPIHECAGVMLSRIIGPMAIEGVDPFVLLEEVRAEPGIGKSPARPHRGFESVCYVIDGGLHHTDDLGNEALIEAGGIEWLTVGRGLVQSESPSAKRPFRGFRIWLNLPARMKLLRPEWRAFTSASVPIVVLNGAEVRLLAGRFHNRTGPVAPPATHPFIADVMLKAEGEIVLPIAPGHQGLVYVLENAACVGKTLINAGQAGILDDNGDTIKLTAGAEPVRALVVSGAPLQEPVVRYREFVMNTFNEIKQAMTDFGDIRP